MGAAFNAAPVVQEGINMKKVNIPMDHPRPALYRVEWKNLNGAWQFAFDDKDEGICEHWEQKTLASTIMVPYCYQSKQSGIGDKGYHPVVWYKRQLPFEEAWRNKQVLLHFEGVDYEFDLWINEIHIGHHCGGNVCASFEISKYLHDGDNTISLRVCDEHDWSKPQGKQAPIDIIDRCWYTQTTGIWKSVWLEVVPKTHLSSIRITPDVDKREVVLELEISRYVQGVKAHVEVQYHKDVVLQKTIFPKSNRIIEKIAIEEPDYVDELHYWTPERPELFDLFLTIEDPCGDCDDVQTYFGMRKIEARNGEIYLNNKPYYVRLVLDQGYWRDSLTTPPENESLNNDIQLTKSLGFNGARKHQKIEDERYYYWADQLGLLVWAEMPSSYAFCTDEITAFTAEWMAVVSQLYNYPCIMTWVPFNESWGIRNVLTDSRQKHFAESAYYLTKAIDNTRLVSTNDGWEQVTSDICGIHDYYGDGEAFLKKYRDMDTLLQRDAQRRKIYADGYAFAGQPIILSEFGGIAFGKDQDGAWGYNETANSKETLFARIRDVTQPIVDHPRISGYCYTQLTDVMQEINGLADANHAPKLDADKVRKIFENPK